MYKRQLFAQIAALLREIIDYDAMEIRLVDEEARELHCGYASDEDVEQMSSWRAPLDVGVSGWVLLHNEAQLVNDMLGDPRGALVPGAEDGESQASIIVPLNVRGNVTGVLCLGRTDGRLFEEHELEPAMLFANMEAIAIQNARLPRGLRRRGRPRRPGGRRGQAADGRRRTAFGLEHLVARGAPRTMRLRAGAQRVFGERGHRDRRSLRGLRRAGDRLTQRRSGAERARTCAVWPASRSSHPRSSPRASRWRSPRCAWFAVPGRSASPPS